MDKVICFLSENTMGLADAYKPIPTEIWENGPYELSERMEYEEGLQRILERYSFEDLFEFNADDGIKVGKVYRRQIQ